MTGSTLITLREAVIVEGKYDKIRLSNILDATIIQTDGFRIFKDAEKRELIRLLAKRTGIIIITDSDSAGLQIRQHIKNIVKDGNVTNIYLPQIVGKEKRKSSPSSEGFLGLEGTDDQIILDALEKAGLSHTEKIDRCKKLTKTDLFSLGLSGNEGSAAKREALCRFLGIPPLPTNTLLDALNTLFERNEFLQVIEKSNQDETDNLKFCILSISLKNILMRSIRLTLPKFANILRITAFLPNVRLYTTTLKI